MPQSLTHCYFIRSNDAGHIYLTALTHLGHLAPFIVAHNLVNVKHYELSNLSHIGMYTLCIEIYTSEFCIVAKAYF